MEPSRSASRVTGLDVARRAGVSKTAVSQVFGGTGRISAETTRRVLTAAAELGYTPAHAARSLRLGRTGLLSMVVPQVDNPYYPEIFAGAREAAAERGYAIDLFAVADSEQARETLRRLGTGMADGVLVTCEDGTDELAPDLRRLRDRGMAVAVTHAAGPDERIPGVRVDIEAGARLAMRHLLGLGHLRIAYVGNLAGASEARHSAYREALAEAGIGYDAALTYGVEPTARSGAEVAAQISATAVFAFNDLVAMGIVHGLAAAGVRVPEDVSVVGFDGIAVSEFTVPALTTVAHPRRELGRQAVWRLCDQLDGVAAAEDVVLTPSLVVRASTLRVRT
jgi:LacI family transcriptional regulator